MTDPNQHMFVPLVTTLPALLNFDNIYLALSITFTKLQLQTLMVDTQLHFSLYNILSTMREYNGNLINADRCTSVVQT